MGWAAGTEPRALPWGPKWLHGRSLPGSEGVFLVFVVVVFWPRSMWDLSSPTNSTPPAVEAWSLNCWTAREVPEGVCKVRAGGTAGLAVGWEASRQKSRCV